MPRPTILLVAALVLASCSGDDEAPPTTSIGAEDSTTTAAETPTTTLDLPIDPTTTLVASPPEGAPTTVLDSFTATSVVQVDIGDNPITVTTEGTRVGESFECISTVDIAEINVTTAAIVTLDGVWLDEGEGYRESNIETVTDVVASCPLHPVFWNDFDTALCPADMTGTAETINGIDTQRVDFAESAELATCMRFTADLEGADFGRFDTWLADDGQWIAALKMDAELDAETAARAFGGLPTEGTTGELAMDIQIADVNDPTLVVEAPQT